MAITVTHLGHGTYGGGDVTMGTTLVSPAPGSMLLLTVRMTASASNANDTDSATGFGATWSKVGAATYTTAARLVMMRAIVGASPGSEQIWYTWQRVESASFPWLWSVDQVTGFDPSGPTRQPNFYSPGAGQGAGSIGVTMSAPKDANSRTFAAYTLLSPVTNLTSQSGWTDLVTNYTGGTSNERLHVTHHPSAFQTAASVSNAGTAYPIIGAVELVAAPDLTVVGPGADSGALTDSGKLWVAGADLGSFTESASGLYTPPAGADTAHVTDAFTISVAYAAVDAGFLDESALVTAVPLGGTDQAAGADNAEVAATLAAPTDSVTLADSPLSTFAATGGADSGTLTEAASILPFYYLADTDAGQLTEQAAPVTAAATAVDTGHLTEASTIDSVEQLVPGDPDAGQLTDTHAALSGELGTADAVSADEQASLDDITYGFPADTDAGTTVDAGAVTGTENTQDDQGQLLDDFAEIVELRYLVDDDAATGTDDQQPASTDTPAADAGSAVEAETLVELVKALGDNDPVRARDRIVAGRLINPTGTSSLTAEDGAVLVETATLGHTPHRYVARPTNGLVTRPRGPHIPRHPDLVTRP